MTKQTFDSQSGTVRPRYLLIGADEEGCDHLYRTSDETILVINGTELVWRQDITNRSVTDWVDFIEQKRGWEDRQLFRSFYEAFAEKFIPEQSKPSSMASNDRVSHLEDIER